jgi:beta-lactamase superfamily II metal-dependent hydrolase
VIFSVGAHNGFGFPHLDVVERARSLGAATWRTDGGAVTAISDGHTVRLARTVE